MVKNKSLCCIIHYMPKKEYKNSLLGQLEQKGYIKENNQSGTFLPFGALTGFEPPSFEDSNKVDSAKNYNKNAATNTIQPKETGAPPDKKPAVKKRLNDFDIDIFGKESPFDSVETIDADNYSVPFLYDFIFKIFPALKKAFSVKKELEKLISINENTVKLMKTKIPYGESDGFYSDFATNLNSVNAIHSKLLKKK